VGLERPERMVTKLVLIVTTTLTRTLGLKSASGKRHSCFHASPRKDSIPRKYFCNLQDTSVILSAHVPWHTVSAWGFNPFGPAVYSCQIITLVLNLCEA
jgi:hypothetical protein